jgi:hypothetical protein
MLASSQQTTSVSKPSGEWVTVTHPHHPLYGQCVQIIRVRRGRDPDLIIRLPDGYHGAIAASSTDYAPLSEAQACGEPPPLLSLAGLWQIAQFIEQKRLAGTMLLTGQIFCEVLRKRGNE